MENYIVINGKKAELTPEQLKALGLEMEINPFKRVEEDKSYFFITGTGEIQMSIDADVAANRGHLNAANYCTDREMMQQRAYAETLNRLLWRYSMEHKGNEIGWEADENKYGIIYDYDEERWRVYSAMYHQHVGAVYFYSKETAESAIREIVQPFLYENPDFKF